MQLAVAVTNRSFDENTLTSVPNLDTLSDSRGAMSHDISFRVAGMFNSIEVERLIVKEFR